MSSGSYFPPPMKAVPIPKKSGGVTDILGIPTSQGRRDRRKAAKRLLPQALEEAAPSALRADYRPAAQLRRRRAEKHCRMSSIGKRKGLNNRAENSHQTDDESGSSKRFKSPRAGAAISLHPRSDRQRFLPPTDRDTAAKFHAARSQAFATRVEIAGVAMAA